MPRAKSVTIHYHNDGFATIKNRYEIFIMTDNFMELLHKLLEINGKVTKIIRDPSNPPK